MLCVGDIISKSLSYVAENIREAIYKVNDEYIRSQLSVILGQQQLDCIKAFFSRQGSKMSIMRPRNHNIHITSWISMPVYEADFGWGKPMHFGLGNEFREDRELIISSSDGDGVIVSMNFQTVPMQLFNKFFYEDV
ncbi:Shikimate O-hydroxycinnamoyltransferase, partial [Mucuna pruriens]